MTSRSRQAAYSRGNSITSGPNTLKFLLIQPYPFTQMVRVELECQRDFSDITLVFNHLFLRREAGFDMNQESTLWKLWEDMLKVEQIRHVLVHSEGEI